MRAIVRTRYGSPDVVTLTETPKPTPARDEVLVKVKAASINTADLDFLSGYPPIARLAFGLLRPRTTAMGCDLAGSVEAAGPDVTRFRPGDDVWADLSGSGYGSFAEYVCVREKTLAAKPAGLSFVEAATVPHSAVLALQGLQAKGPIRPGNRVLINGAGGCVGPFAVQLAKSFGAEVTGVDSAAKLDWISSIGADHVIDYTRQDFTRNGQRYDHILDIAAHGSVLRYRRSLTRHGGYVLIARNLVGFVQAFALGGAISIAGHKRLGIFSWSPSRRADLDTLSGYLETRKIAPLIDSQCEFEGVPDALRKLAAGRARGKIVIVMP
jgi:NADPH:quinone reductase-like Zn-dependent oxidoreductase